MKKLLSILFLVVTFWPVLAQQPQLLQERRYLVKANYTDILASTQDKLGNIYYSGITWTSTNKWDNYFLKVGQNTDTIWTRKNPQKLDYSFVAIHAMPNSEFVAGSNFGNQQIGMSLRRMNTNGSGLWNRNYSTPPSLVSSFLALPGKDLLLGGGYIEDFAFTRTDSLGNVKWSKAYNWSLSGDDFISMQFTKAGNIIAAGNTNKPVGPTHLKLMLVNQNGDSLIGRQLIMTDSSRVEAMNLSFSSVTSLSDGGALITAAVDTVTAAAPGGTYLGMVVKVDANLNYQWKYIHRNPAGDEYKFTRAKELTDGTIVVLGFKIRPVATGNLNNFQIFRFSSQGQLINVYPFTSNICNQVWGITLDALSDSTLMIGGRCGNFNPNNYGFYVAKVKIPGLPLPLPPVSISGTKEELAAENSLGQSYPNPTAAEAIIPYSLPRNYRKANIIIREIATGREIRKYDLKRNDSSLKVDLSSFSNGLYLYSLEIDDKPIATKKLAVMK